MARAQPFHKAGEMLQRNILLCNAPLSMAHGFANANAPLKAVGEGEESPSFLPHIEPAPPLSNGIERIVLKIAQISGDCIFCRSTIGYLRQINCIL